MVELKDILREDQWFRPHAELLWERIDKLGAGGMGVVYRVRDNCLGRDAALKLLLDESSPRVLKRFIREATITARLNHPAIPPVYEAGKVASGQHYMVMKVIEGETLESRIASLYGDDYSEKGLRDLLQALAKVGEAISYA
ncbi:MAG: protein kinase, partial [Planctomycetota bacterium]|nr:protein kinase [Planctomycetota bacterium]